MTFTTTNEEDKRFSEFVTSCCKKTPTPKTEIGGRFTVSFTLSNYGRIIEVVDNLTDTALEITDVN